MNVNFAHTKAKYLFASINASILNFICYWYLIISLNYEKELIVDVKSFIKKNQIIW